MTPLLFFSDILSVTAAFFGAYFLRNIGPSRLYLQEVQPLSVYLAALPAAVVLLLAIISLKGLYSPQKRLKTFGELYEIIAAVNIWMLLIMSGSYLVKYDYSRIIVVLFWILTLICILLSRSIVRWIHQKNIQQGTMLTNILILGAGRFGKTIEQQLQEYREVGYHVVGFIDDIVKHPRVLGSMQELPELIRRHSVDQIYIADPSLSYQRTLQLIHDCSDSDIEFKIASNIFPLLSEIQGIRAIERIPSLDLKKANPNLLYKGTKRLFDLVGGFVVLLMSLPLWALIALLVKRDSSGPIFVIQERVGLNGAIFRMYKFRTMLAETPLYQEAPRNGQDPRVTRVGQWLRKTSLDELPQLINILKGEMSLVGPRPEMPFIVEQYEPWQRKRLNVKPGLTGLWQILGRKDHPLTDNLEYDFYYINNQSILLDLVILLKTIPLVIKRKGAF